MIVDKSAVSWENTPRVNRCCVTTYSSSQASGVRYKPRSTLIRRPSFHGASEFASLDAAAGDVSCRNESVVGLCYLYQAVRFLAPEQLSYRIKIIIASMFNLALTTSQDESQYHSG